jgi:hypothetical protein
MCPSWVRALGAVQVLDADLDMAQGLWLDGTLVPCTEGCHRSALFSFTHVAEMLWGSLLTTLSCFLHDKLQNFNSSLKKLGIFQEASWIRRTI